MVQIATRQWLPHRVAVVNVLLDILGLALEYFIPFRSIGVLSQAIGLVSFCVLGAYATHVLISANHLVPLEENDGPVKIAVLPLNYMTA